MMKNRVFFSFVAISYMLCNSVFADDVKLDDVEVTQSFDDGYRAVSSDISKTMTPILEIPQTINVITNQQIKDKKPESLAESLANVSGVSYANTTGGIFDAIIKRGFGEGRDGSIMRNGVSAGVMHSFNKSIESVEVLKGPASMLYGAGGPGGIINMVTKKPLYESQNEIWGGLGNLRYKNTGFDSTGAIGESGFAYRFIFDYTKKDYWREFGDFENTFFAPSLSYKGDDYRINFAYTHTNAKSPIDRGMYLTPSNGEILPIDKKVRLDEPINKMKAKVDTVDVNFEKNIGESWLLRGAYAFSRSKHEYGHVRVTDVNLAKGTASRTNEYYENFIHRTHAGSINLNGILQTGSISHNLLFGVDLKDYYRYRPGSLSDKISPDIDIFNPVYGNVGKATTRAKTIQYQKLKTIAPYVQDSINLTDNLIYSLGVRYEYYDQKATNDASKQKFSTDQQDGQFTYQTGLLYLLTPEWSVYTNYAQSFKPQMVIGSSDIGDVAPEKGSSIEFGTKFQNDAITATAAIFDIDKKNIMRTIANESTLVGKANSRGFEFDFNGRVTKYLNLSTSYAYTKTKVVKDSGDYAVLVGKPLEATPKHQASIFANYDLTQIGLNGLRAGAGARYFGSWQTYYMNKNAPINGVPVGTAFKIPHAVVYDAFISYDTKISGLKTNFSLNAKNLTNKLYYTSSSTGTSAKIIPIQPGYARQIMLTASVKF